MAVKKLSTDKFEEYFQRADADGDGRISGKEAVDFFQGSDLSRPILAQIWEHADQNETGFLSRTEFYNALKLVTVAQSKRELTENIVKAALHGPAFTKIPAPEIKFSAIPTPPSNTKAALHGPASAKIPAPEINSAATPTPRSNTKAALHGPASAEIPAPAIKFAATPTPPSNTKAALHGKEGAASASSTTTQPKTPEIKELFRSSSSVGNATSGKQESKSHSPTENCCPFDFGDLFSPSPSQPKQKPVPLTNSAHATLTSLTDRSTETKANRIYSAQSQHPWPRMTRPDVQKYSKVFEQVDTDRDGKITAQQARNLFFRLKLPQDVLEIVWGLPNQKNDNMLTLREFCIALHLIESPVPVVPSSGQPAAAYGQENAEITVLEKHHVSQLDTVEQDSLNTKFQEADKKIWKYADVIRAGFLGRREFGNGEFLNKDSDQLSQYFDFDAASEREQFWDMDNISQYFDFDAASEREQFWDMNNISHRSRSTTESLVGDKYRIREEDGFNARLATLANKVEAIELWKLNGVASTSMHTPKVNKDGCCLCENMEHSTNLCPMIPIFKEVLRDREANATNTFKKPYQNPYSEEAYNFVPYNSTPKRSLEDTLQRFMESQTVINNQTSEAINDIRSTLTKLTASSSNQGNGG